LWLQSPVSVVVHGSCTLASICCSSICRPCWLRQYLLYLSFVAPVSIVAHGSSICRSFMAPVVSVVHGTSICRLVLWLQLRLQAPVLSVVACGSSGGCRSCCGSSIISCRLCRLWLQYLSIVVAPVAVAVACGSSICRLRLQSPVSVVVRGSSSICCRLWL